MLFLIFSICFFIGAVLLTLAVKNIEPGNPLKFILEKIIANIFGLIALFCLIMFFIKSCSKQ